MLARLHLHATIVAAVATAMLAAALAWMCDDAFISIRYADHLVHGDGLVYNPGEHVEGYSNFLWTMWCALGIVFDMPVHTWCHVASVAAAVGTVLLLGWMHHARRAKSNNSWSVPLAALTLVLHRDFLVHSTSGLETALFTFLIVAAFALLTHGELTLGRSFGVGAVLGLAALTRPDAPLVAGVCGLYTVWRAPRRVAAGVAIFAGFAVFWLPHLAWRFAFYGSLVPNTALAKSAHLSWWSQGAVYVGAYLQRYPLLALGPLLCGGRMVRMRANGWRSRPDLLLAAAIAVIHATYVARVGGDFMFARFLVPITPLLLWSLEGELFELLGASPVRRVAGWLAVGALTVWMPPPVSGTVVKQGIADEYDFYTARPAELGGKSTSEHTRDMGAALRPFLEGTDAEILVIGSQARLAWESRARYVLEANGLTDRVIASQPLIARGRPGHEKHPTYSYVVRRRGTNFAFSQTALQLTRGRIPTLAARFGDVQGLVLTWDSALMTELAQRGVELPDYLGMLDATIANLPQMTTQTATRMWSMHNDFYFRHNKDAVRRSAFERRLAR